MDPGLEAIGVPKLREPAPGQDEGVLQRVLGEPGIAQDPDGNRVELITDLVHQDRERLPITVPGLFDQGSVHLDPPGAAATLTADYPS